MATRLHRNQLRTLCSDPETYEKAESILRLVTARTGQGSGFVVNPVAVPAVCAYLASEQLNTGEVSLKSAATAACVTQATFSDILKTVRAALHTDDEGRAADVTYQTLASTYRIHRQEYAVACMEDTEAGLPRIDILKDRYGANVVLCAIFYWVAQVMEEPIVQERSFCQSHSISLKAFRSAMKTIDKQCDAIGDQIKSHLLEIRRSTQAAASTSTNPDRFPTSTPTSPQKSPTKSALKATTRMRDLLTPSKTPSNKRGVVFSNDTLNDNDDDSSSFPETPTKKRRVDSLSPTKPSAGTSSARRLAEPQPAAMAAFHAAASGSTPKQPRTKNAPKQAPVGDVSASPDVGPSTPHRPHTRSTAMPMPVDHHLSPSRSQVQAQPSPTRPAPRRRFRPVFLDLQQWCARDPKVERMWADIEMHRNETGASI
ncbi:hypothetical protein BU15DRAFT_56206 [Melanogaster broomeanus]|nr:hypothetical protein BU15DRAFT_56206 [Melanogaster broomeanus]